MAFGVLLPTSPAWKLLAIIYYHHNIGFGLCLLGDGVSPEWRELLETT